MPLVPIVPRSKGSWPSPAWHAYCKTTHVGMLLAGGRPGMILAIAKSIPRCPRSLTLGEVRLRLQLPQDGRRSTQPDTFYVPRGTLA